MSAARCGDWLQLRKDHGAALAYCLHCAVRGQYIGLKIRGGGAVTDPYPRTHGPTRNSHRPASSLLPDWIPTLRVSRSTTERAFPPKLFAAAPEAKASDRLTSAYPVAGVLGYQCRSTGPSGGSRSAASLRLCALAACPRRCSWHFATTRSLPWGRSCAAGAVLRRRCT